MTSRTGPGECRLSLVAALVLACVSLAACQTRTNVSATANVPAQYSHVWLTFRQIGFNASAAAGPADGGWQQFTLPAPQTVDLAAVSNGTLSQFASQLSLPAGTYHQMRVVLSDSTETLTSSAQSAQALYNDEVEYTDGGGTVHQVPLEIPNAAQGIGFAIDLTVQTSDKAALAALGCAAGAGTTSSTFGASSTFGSSTGSPCASPASSATTTVPTCGSGFAFDSTTGTCVTNGTTLGTTGAATTGTSPVGTQCATGLAFDSTSGSCVPETGSNGSTACAFGSTSGSGACTSSSLNTAATTSTAIDFDAARDLVPYEVSGQPGYLLIPHLAEYDLSRVGTIQGQVGIAALAPGTAAEVSAETLSSDGSRHIVVKSAPLRSDGSFVLYPLSTASGSPTQYDLVIHGPGVGTVIIKSVPVTSGTPASATSLALTGITLASAGSFAANLASAGSVSARGASIGFYQTLPGSGEVPYLIETYPIDPFTGAFDAGQLLCAADLAFGTYASGGTTLAAAAPAEGAATYHVAASAPLYGDGALATTVAAPSSGSGAATFTVAAPSLPGGASAASITGTVSVAAPGRYDRGELLLTQNGALTAVVPLDAYLGSAESAATLFSAVPGGTSGGAFDHGVYYAEAWVWSSADPAGTLSRQPQTAAIDLSGGSASGVAVSIE